MAVLHRTHAGRGAHLGAFLTGGAEADQRTDDRSELLQLVLRHVALLQSLDVPIVVLAHGDQVDQPHDVVILQPRELLADRALELGIDEADHEYLHRA